MSASVWTHIDSAFNLRCARSKVPTPNWIACISSGWPSPKIHQGDFCVIVLSHMAAQFLPEGLKFSDFLSELLIH